MNQHTKGEWKVEESNRETVLGDVLYYIEANDDVVAHEIESLANAQLIASAPDLYEALKGIIENGDKMKMDAQTAIKIFPYIKQAEKALAKAEGKE